jgi:recombination protein RecA
LARLMGKACRKLQSVMKPKSATVVFINQIRFKIGVSYGNPETTCVTLDTLVDVEL